MAEGSWRELAPQLVSELGQLDPDGVAEWIRYWRQRCFPFQEFLRALWLYVSAPRAEGTVKVEDLVDAGLLLEGLRRRDAAVGWNIVERQVPRFRRRLGPAPEVSGCQADPPWPRGGNGSDQEGTAFVCSPAASWWRIAYTLHSYWPGAAGPWAGAGWMRPGLVAGPVWEESDRIRPLDHHRHVVELVVRHGAARPDGAVGEATALLREVALTTRGLKTAELRFLVQRLLATVLTEWAGTDWTFWSRQFLAGYDTLFLARWAATDADERRMVWSVMGWAVLLGLTAGPRETRRRADQPGDVSAEAIWEAIEGGRADEAAAIAEAWGESVGEWWEPFLEDAVSLALLDALRMVRPLYEAYRGAAGVERHHLLPVAAYSLARTRQSAVVGSDRAFP